MIEMTARDLAAFLREWETPLRRELATAKSMGQTEHEGNQRLSAKLGDAEKHIAVLERRVPSLEAAWEGAEKQVAEQAERIAELEQLERERVALFKRKDAHISKQAERIAELEAQLQGARAEVSKEREAARVLAEERDVAKATLQHAYAEGYWLGRTSLGAAPEKGATMPCATCGRDVREWVGSGCESCDPTLHPSWPGAERPGPQVGGPFPLMKGDILGDGEDYAEIRSPKAIEDFGWATVVWRKGRAVWVKA